ncbi:MAG: hypothetical protein ACR2QH_15190 [Geminicoccaceae bacterium]
MSDLEIELSQTQLVDDVRDELLAILKELPDVWDKLGEKREREWIARVAELATTLTRGCCDIIAADGRTVLECQVHKGGINETTIEAKVSVPNNRENLLSFGGACHGPATLAFVNYEKFTTEHKRPEATTDQTRMFADEPKPIGDSVDKIMNKVTGKKGKVKGPAAAAMQEYFKSEADDPLAELEQYDGLPPVDPAPTPTKRKTSPRRTVQRSTIRAGRRGKSEVAVERKKAQDGFSLVEDD